MTNFKAGKYGNKYERLMLPELVEAFQIYEGERADRRHTAWKHIKDKPQQPMTEEQRDLFKKLAEDLNLPEDDTDDNGRWKFIVHPNSEGQLCTPFANVEAFRIYYGMEGLVIAMVILAFVDIGVEYYISNGLRVNEMVIALLGILFLCL